MCLDVARQVASAIESIHSQDLVHLDLHARNIFIECVLAALACLRATLESFVDVRHGGMFLSYGPHGWGNCGTGGLSPGLYTVRKFYLAARSILILFLRDWAYR